MTSAELLGKLFQVAPVVAVMGIVIWWQARRISWLEDKIAEQSAKYLALLETERGR